MERFAKLTSGFGLAIFMTSPTPRPVCSVQDISFISRNNPEEMEPFINPSSVLNITDGMWLFFFFSRRSETLCNSSLRQNAFSKQGVHGDVIKTETSVGWTKSIANTTEIKAALKAELPPGGLGLQNEASVQKVIWGSDRRDDTDFTLLIWTSRQLVPQSKLSARGSIERLQFLQLNEKKWRVGERMNLGNDSGNMLNQLHVQVNMRLCWDNE